MDNADGITSGDSERRLLLRATVTMGTVAGVAAAVPFVASMSPSARALSEGAPVEVNLAAVAPGNLITVAWRGKPVWILHRTLAMIESLQRYTEMLSDPQSTRSEQPVEARNVLRSVKPKFAVLLGLCTHLGCIPSFRPDVAPADLGPTWLGGFYCPCHGSKFDLAGRVFKGVPAPVNLVIPPHSYLASGMLLIGA
ncbi:ubiquinol-cytochrome c reductase iron-sulfur subunit [Herbaspirillum sp. HC18]|nr:ubiquinol-cytochrome c reductase iron-sulfur subunit [Herbaspirillum sp. HC18]